MIARIPRWLLDALAWTVARVWFRRIEIVGRVPRGRPVVLVANHVNGFLDPVLIMGAVPGLQRFLAAGILWRYPPTRVLLALAGALPAYRTSDHADTRRNVSTFAHCHDALARGEQVALFPEGDVHDQPGLLPLKTGAARIALGAAHDATIEGIAIVPVGLTYGERPRFRSTCEVFVGEPIEVDEWARDGGESDHGLVHDLTEEIERRLRSVTLDDTSWEIAALVDAAAAAYALDRADGTVPRLTERTEIHRRLANAWEKDGGEHSDTLARLRETTEAYRDAMAHLALGPKAPLPDRSEGRENAPRTLATLLTLPFAAIGIALNAVPALITAGVARLVRDPAWHASVALITALVAFPVAWAIEGTMARWIWEPGRWLPLVAALTGYVAVVWTDSIRVLARALRARWRGRGGALEEARRTRRAVADLVAELI